MNKFNPENQNRIDNLRIQQAISGLDQDEQQALRQLVERTEQAELAELAERELAEQQAILNTDNHVPGNSVDAGEEFGEFQQCVALVDVWLASNSEVTLTADQRRRLLKQFVNEPVNEPVKGRFGERLSDGNPNHRRGDRGWSARILGGWRMAAVAVAATVCLMLASSLWINPASTVDSANSIQSTSVAELRKQMLADPPTDMLRWVWNGGANDSTAEVFWGDVIWSDVRQRGYALLDIRTPIEDPYLYQIRIFQEIQDELPKGIVCGEFRFDGYASPFVVVLRPEETVSSPQQFTVARSPDEPNNDVSGPNINQGISLVAEANSSVASAEPELLPQMDAVISNDPVADTF